jgi:hypothetical protein
MELSGSTMITALEQPFPNFGGDPQQPFEEGVLIWDISDPINPRRLGQFRTRGTGTHRNFYAGGRYMHVAAGMPGYQWCRPKMCSWTAAALSTLRTRIRAYGC